MFVPGIEPESIEGMKHHSTIVDIETITGMKFCGRGRVRTGVFTVKGMWEIRYISVGDHF